MAVKTFKDSMDELAALREAEGFEKNGVKYLSVNQRVDFFRRMAGTDYGIDTNMVCTGPGFVITAKIVHGGMVIGSGIVYSEWSGTHPVPTAETKAIGRALASIGFGGGEYPSFDEMQAVEDRNPPVDKSTGRSDNASPKEREFREEVEKVFPSVGGFNYYVPLNNSPEEIDRAFEEIDRINTVEELTAYHHELQEFMMWVTPDIAGDIKATFKSRSKQLRG